MSGPLPRREGDSSPPAGKKAPPSPLASTTDLGRFPETPGTGEITSLLGAGPREPAPEATQNQAASAPRAAESSRKPEVNLDFDPQIKIERKIGAGGMGEVFLGFQKHLDRKVAVKRIRAWDADARGRERFIQEAKAHSCLQHPGIAQVYDFRESGDSFYLIMEYVPGKTLEELQAAEAQFPPERIAKIGVQLTEALESAAHEGYIHRDLKPGNVMLTEDGKVKIIDFGLALRFRNLMQTRFTRKGDILGTPAYMSPEQLNLEENLDVRSDIWSLGVLLYALATGGPPFTGKDFACTLRNVMMQEPAPLPTIEPGFPPGLWQAIAKALAKDRAERWQDYASFREALLGSIATAGASGDAAPPAESSAPGRRRWQLVGWAALAACSVAAVLVPNAFRAPKEGGKEETRLVIPADHSTSKGPFPEVNTSEKQVDPPNPAKAAGETSPVKREHPDPPSPEPPPKLKLRDRLIASPPSAGAVEWLEGLLVRFERHAKELETFSYEPLAAELALLGKSEGAKDTSDGSAQDRELRSAYLRAAEKMVALAKGALRARLEDLRSSKTPVTLRLRAGGTASGVVDEISAHSITLRADAGQSTTVEFERISPEEFRPKAAPEVAELAFQALSIQPSRTVPALLDVEASDEEVFLWLPLVVRLARLEVEAKSRQAAAESKPILLESRAPESSTSCLASWTAAKAAQEFLAKSEPRMPAAYGMLAPEFAKAKRELDAIELLFHRQYSRAVALFPNAAAGTVAAALYLELFENDLKAGADELLEGSGWFNWRWELRPTHPDVKERRKFLLPNPDEEVVILQDEEGPRSLVMNDITSRAPEGVLLRVRLESLGNRPEAAEWRFHLLSEKGGTSYLRVAGGHVELCRTTLAPGAADVRLARVPLPSIPVEQRWRTFAVVPGAEHLLVYVDRQLLLSVPRKDAAIPKQLALVVIHGKLSIRNLEVKRVLAKDGESPK